MARITVNDIVLLVNEIETEDPIDWNNLNLDEQLAIEFIANNILDQYNTTWINLSDSDRTLTMLATITKLIVENFTLNLKLRQ
jgi:hypothetical protein